MKKKSEDPAYTFGVEGYWVLAPDRHGAHNWEYTGHWTVSTAYIRVRLSNI